MAKVLVMKHYVGDGKVSEGAKVSAIFYRADGKLKARPPEAMLHAEAIVERAIMAKDIEGDPRHPNVHDPEVFDRVLPGWSNGYTFIEPQEVQTPPK